MGLAARQRQRGVLGGWLAGCPHQRGEPQEPSSVLLPATTTQHSTFWPLGYWRSQDVEGHRTLQHSGPTKRQPPGTPHERQTGNPTVSTVGGCQSEATASDSSVRPSTVTTSLADGPSTDSLRRVDPSTPPSPPPTMHLRTTHTSCRSQHRWSHALVANCSAVPCVRTVANRLVLTPGWSRLVAGRSR